MCSLFDQVTVRQSEIWETANMEASEVILKEALAI